MQVNVQVISFVCKKLRRTTDRCPKFDSIDNVRPSFLNRPIYTLLCLGEFPGRNVVFNKTIAGRRRTLLLYLFSMLHSDIVPEHHEHTHVLEFNRS